MLHRQISFQEQSARQVCFECVCVDIGLIILLVMDAATVASQLQTHKIREGPIYKRTKFLQEWEQRWAVLTMNFLFIFTNRTLKEVTDYIDLRDVLSYKSYLRKDDDMIPAGFKLTTADEMHYFCARNCNEKWSWMVTIERLMDFKYTGKSPYNSIDWITTRGFMSQGEFERGKFDERVDPTKPKQPEKPKEAEKSKEVPKVDEKDLQKLKKELQQELKRARGRQQQLERREKEQQELFILQLNKLKKAEEALKELQAEVELKTRQADRIIAERAEEKPREIIVQKIVERIVEKPVEVVVQKSVEVIVQKSVEVIVQKPVQVIVEKPVEVVVQKQVQVEKKQQEPAMVKRQSAAGQKVSEMRRLYESKMDIGKQPTATVKPTPQQKKEESKSKEDFLYLCRDRVILNLFEEFHSKAYSYGGLRPIVEFLIKICSQRSLGYQQYFIREAKAHENRFVFAEVFLQLVCNSKEQSGVSGRALSKLVEVLIFEAPGIFKINHFDILKRKMADLFLHSSDEGEVAVVLKTMYVVHKVKKYDKDAAVHDKLKAVESGKSEEAKNWARKLLEDI